SSHRTRKQSQRNIEDYASIVEADDDQPQQEYASEYRGRVQNRQVELTPQPLFALSFHRATNGVSRYMPFHKSIDALNSTGLLSWDVYITNHEPQLSESELQRHFADIASLTVRIDQTPATDTQTLATLYFGRALHEYHVRDFDSACHDLERATALRADDVLSSMLLAQVRSRQAEVLAAESDAESLTARLGASAALDEMRRVTEIAPTMPYAWYNLGNAYLINREYARAREAYTRALNIDPRMPDAYYNRGLAALLEGNTASGLADLSQAGEYGIYSAYNLIKRYSKEK
ncbi:MAG: tetratricopeptide repeat protein, partial [Actinomycetaceae bacterium]|nr:tetratricopeptide repeat protein [Actinomycetaceae bacterium]